MARELVEDPEYQEALRRRLADSKAPRMMRLLLQWPDQKARDPQELWRGKPPLTVVLKHLPGQYDPLAENTRQRQMIEAKAREEQKARARQEARDKQSADATPEDPPESEVLEVYYREE